MICVSVTLHSAYSHILQKGRLHILCFLSSQRSRRYLLMGGRCHARPSAYGLQVVDMYAGCMHGVALWHGQDMYGVCLPSPLSFSPPHSGLFVCEYHAPLPSLSVPFCSSSAHATQRLAHPCAGAAQRLQCTVRAACMMFPSCAVSLRGVSVLQLTTARCTTTPGELPQSTLSLPSTPRVKFHFRSRLSLSSAAYFSLLSCCSAADYADYYSACHSSPFLLSLSLQRRRQQLPQHAAVVPAHASHAPHPHHHSLQLQLLQEPSCALSLSLSLSRARALSLFSLTV